MTMADGNLTLGLGPEDLALVSEFIELLQSRPTFYGGEPKQHREDRADEHVIAALDLVRRACGDDVIRESYGDSGSDRAASLLQFSKRARLASFAYGPIDRGPGSLSEAESEARAVAQGDLSRVFSRLDQRRKAIRLLRAKFLALRWDAWLAGIGINAVERHAAIAFVFGAEWDTVARWRADVEEAWGGEALDQLRFDTRDAKRNLRMDILRAGEPWQQGLKRAGKVYKLQLKKRSAEEGGRTVRTKSAD